MKRIEQHYRLTLNLPESMYNLLNRMAQEDMRDGRQQIVWLVREEAIKRGLLRMNKSESSAVVSKAADAAL